MRDLLPELERWQVAGKPIAIATVITVVGSAPRNVGATLALTAVGDIAGSVSGGCVEPAVIEAGLKTLRTGQPKLLSYGITEEQNVEQIGLSCGGEIRVYVERLGDIARLRDALAAERPIARALLLTDGQDAGSLVIPETGTPDGTLGDAALDKAAAEIARARLRRGDSGGEGIPDATSTERETFFAVFPAPPALIIIGAGHIAIPLSQIAHILGYHVTVVDARETFATHERFPGVDELLVEWPDEALGHLPLTGTTAIAVLSHDAKFDEPALVAALNSPAGYIGAIGSRGTRAERDERLRKQRISEEQLARIHGPIGLDIGARTPEEIALAIMAEIIASRHGPSRQ